MYRLIHSVKDTIILGKFLNLDVIRKKGKQLLQEINALLPEDEKILFKFKSGWIWKYQRKLSLESRKINEEKGDAKEAAAAREAQK